MPTIPWEKYNNVNVSRHHCGQSAKKTETDENEIFEKMANVIRGARRKGGEIAISVTIPKRCSILIITNRIM